MALNTIVHDLCMYTPSLPDELVQVLGYHEPGDGGGGAFYWDSTAADPIDGGTLFAAPAGRWKRLFDGPIQVQWFGARGDGITDDTSAIQAAHRYYTAGKGSVLYAPGTYLISDTINIQAGPGTRIEGNGAVLKPNASFPAINIQGAAFRYEGLNIDFSNVAAADCDENTIGMIITAEGLTNASQVNNAYIGNFRMRFVHTGIKKDAGEGAMWQVVVSNVFIEVNAGAAIEKAAGIQLLEPVVMANNTTLHLNKVSIIDAGARPLGVGYRGIHVSGFTDVYIDGCSVDYIQAAANGDLIDVYTRQLTIRNCYFERCENTCNLNEANEAPICCTIHNGTVDIDNVIFLKCKTNCGGGQGAYFTFNGNPVVKMGNVVNVLPSSDDDSTGYIADMSVYRGDLISIGNVKATDLAFFTRNANRCFILSASSVSEGLSTAPGIREQIWTNPTGRGSFLLLVRGQAAYSSTISFTDMISINSTQLGAAQTLAVISTNQIGITGTNVYAVSNDGHLLFERNWGALGAVNFWVKVVEQVFTIS